jgi:predicted enzyme related to lactoylglutathione lyase
MPNPLARHGGLTYLEIPAADAAASATFYEKVLGWEIERRNETTFKFSDGAGMLIGSFAVGRAPSRQPGFTLFFYVDGLDNAVARATQHGGEVDTAPVAEGDTTIARVHDPAGNLIGLWQFNR